MLLFSLQLIHHFLGSSSLLTHIGETANFDCTKKSFSITISNTSHHIYVALRINPEFFFFYLPSLSSQRFNWGVPLKQFCDHLSHGIEYSSMCFAIYEQYPPSAILEFYNCCKYIPISCYFLTHNTNFECCFLKLLLIKLCNRYF